MTAEDLDRDFYTCPVSTTEDGKQRKAREHSRKQRQEGVTGHKLGTWWEVIGLHQIPKLSAMGSGADHLGTPR